jgi:hypothetical protein
MALMHRNMRSDDDPQTEASKPPPENALLLLLFLFVLLLAELRLSAMKEFSSEREGPKASAD